MIAFLHAHLQHLIAMGGLLCLSAGFSGSETALFSLRPAALNTCRHRRDWFDRCLLRLRGQLEDVLNTILLGNLIVNIIYFSLAAVLSLNAPAEWGGAAAFTINMACTLILIICGEVLPKNIAAALQLPVCRLTAAPLLALHVILTPANLCLRKITAYFQRALVPAPPPADPQENLRLLFEHYRQEGVVNPDEFNSFTSIIALNDIRAREIMTPRVDTVAVDAAASPETVIELARTSRHSKILVHDAIGDRYLGWVDAREYFCGTRAPIRETLRPLLYLSEFSTAESALRRMLTVDAPLAVVVDEHGADIGILVLTDIIAEIFGEFGESGTPAYEPVRRETDGAYLLDSQVSTRALQDIVGAQARLPGVATVGGLVTALLGRTAKINDMVQIGDFTLTVVEVAHRRPTELRLTATAAASAENPD